MACVRSYRERISGLWRICAALDVWYARIDKKAVLASLSDAETMARLRKRLAKAAAHTVAESDFPKMVEGSGGRFVIKDDPPLIYHDQSINMVTERDNIADGARPVPKVASGGSHGCCSTVTGWWTSPLKVVGVGSVGTFCAILLMMAEDDDPLFLQVKEARASVLEPYVGKSIYANHGQRVVVGQRLMQSASDMFLGWAEGKRGRHFYVRQLRDMKMKPLVEIFNPATMLDYARAVRLDARARARPLGRRRDDCRICRQERSVRQGNRALFDELCRPGRARPRRLHERHSQGPDRSPDGALNDRHAMSHALEKIKEEFLAMLPPTIFFFVALHIVALVRTLMVKATGISCSC